MTTQTIADASIYEQTLLSIIRTLPLEQVIQILTYARYVQTQTLDDFALVEEERPEAVAMDEARWDAQFTATQAGLQQMAAKVRAEIQAGKTRPMVFTKDGRIIAG